jgi:membrane protein YdbS with pleckstrin-like domain
MKDFDHLLMVWQGQPKLEPVGVDEVLKQVKKGMSSLTRNLFWSITGMLLALFGIFMVMLFFVFHSWVTYAGIAVILFTMVIYVLVMIRDYRLIHKQDLTTNPSAYLEGLKEYQRSRATIYGWMYYLYVLLLSIGLTLYFFEVLQSATTAFKLAAYGLTAAWLLFCTFYLKGRIFASEQEKLNLMIDRLSRLQNQFD